MKRVLAFSSSRAGDTGYLELAQPVIWEFLKDSSRKIAFIPFASVDGYDDYARKVEEALDLPQGDLFCIQDENAREFLEDSSCIVTSGGNTFKLLHDLYRLSLVDLLRERILAGVPYIGWSAGSNILGPTIGTTNDMPIIAPPSLKALGVFEFQINPHYHNATLAGFHGETRDQRLTEYLKLNPASTIIALPEGSFLRAEGDRIGYQGTANGYVLRLSGGTLQKSSLEPDAEIAG